MTWGKEIASTQFYPPHMYLVLFLIGLPGQYFFGVTLMTMSAVVSTYVFGVVYFASTGIYFFYDSYIPIAVFLGMHLLFTDPSTSPRTELGRILFGVLYGLSTVAALPITGQRGNADVLRQASAGALVEPVDQGHRSSRALQNTWALDPAALGRTMAPLHRHLAFISIWAIVFAGMSAVQGVGDDHPGQWVPFWRQACQDGRAYACPYLADLELGFCSQGSGWACNEAGLMHIALSRSGEDLRRTRSCGSRRPTEAWVRTRVSDRLQKLEHADRRKPVEFASAPPTLEDFPIILRGSKGELRERDPAALYALACREGWPDTCNRTQAALKP